MKKNYLFALLLLVVTSPIWAQSQSNQPAGEKVQVVVVSLKDVQTNHNHLVRIAKYNGLKSSNPFKAYLKVYDQFVQHPKDRDAMQDLVQVQQITAQYLDGHMSSLFKHSFTKDMSVEDIMPIFRAFFQ